MHRPISYSSPFRFLLFADASWSNARKNYQLAYDAFKSEFIDKKEGGEDEDSFNEGEEDIPHRKGDHDTKVQRYTEDTKKANKNKKKENRRDTGGVELIIKLTKRDEEFRALEGTLPPNVKVSVFF